MLIKYPFNDSEELQKCLGSLKVSFDIDTIQDSMATAADTIMDVISKPVYDLAIQYFETPPAPENVNKDAFNQLIELVKYPLAQLAFYDHFIWLQLNISNDRITTHKGTDETTLYKYQADEAKASLLKRYGMYVNMLIDFLNTTEISVTRDVEGVPTTTIELIPEWAESEQYTTLQGLPLTSYKEFDNLFSIDRDAAFFMKCRSILKEVFEDEILPIIGELDADIKADAGQMRKINRFLVYRTMELAVFRFDYNYLPAPIRRDIDNEMTKKNGSEFSQVKEKIMNQIGRKAQEYCLTLDMFKTQEGKLPADLPYKSFETTQNETDSFVVV